MRKFSFVTAAKLSLIALFMQGVAPEAAEVRVIASPSLSAAMEEIGPHFERASGHSLVISYGLIAPMRRHIETGESFDLAIIPAVLMDSVAPKGKFATDTITEMARISMGIAARAGATQRDISSSLDAFKRALLNAQSVTYIPDEPTGLHVTKVFERLAIAELMKAKTKSQHLLQDVVHAVASGEAELGFALISNIVSERGVQLIGRFPPEVQYQVVLKAGIAASAKQGNAAQALVRHLMTPEALAVMKAKGLEPPTQ